MKRPAKDAVLTIIRRHPLVREFVKRTQERHRCVVHQNVRRANAFDHLGEEPFPILGFRQIGALIARVEALFSYLRA